MQVYTINQRRM